MDDADKAKNAKLALEAQQAEQERRLREATEAAARKVQQERLADEATKAAEAKAEAAQELEIIPTPFSNSELELKTKAFIRSLFSSTSDTNEVAINFLKQNMEDDIIFYGKLTKKDEILKAKVKFMARWPVRTYSERLASLKIKCGYSNQKCLVDGIMDWDARNQINNRVSVGVAKFFYEIQFINGAAKIIAENSEVIERK